ncbi:MAG TPA: DUF881 domain-containing protein [Actinomycetes bacterium]|nr:DUF881 domain-containing protein [Actinomycetes bacterium]
MERTAAWRVLVIVVLVLIGVLLATSARLAAGTDLRAERRTDLVGLIRAEQDRVRSDTERVTDLQAEVDAAVQEEAPLAADPSLESQISEVSGAGLVVELDDAPLPASGVPPGYTADDYVVHEQDLHAVINALWAGGAEAMAVMDQRIIGTSAVRCVGSTLLVHGRVYPPPYRVTAIGPPERMQRALDASPRVDLYRQYVDLLGLRLDVDEDSSLTVPAYEGPLSTRYAQAVE